MASPDGYVRPSRALDPATRTVPVLVCDKPTTVELPRDSQFAIPLRFQLYDGQIASREVTIDRGEGPETWRVTISRRSE